MQTSIEQLEGLKQKLLVEMDWESISNDEAKKYQELMKKTRIDGFRPGKVPLNIVKQRFGAAVREEIIHLTMAKTFEEVVEEQSISFVGIPEFDMNNETTQEGATLAFSVIYEVLPEFEVNDAAGDSVTKITAKITDSDLEEALEGLRKQRVEWKDVERAAQDKDSVTIDFEGFLNGEAFEGGSAKGYQLELGSKSMIDGFEENIIGMKAGEMKDIHLTFPEKYHNDKLAGKDVTFKITMQAVEEPILPELDEKFADSFGVKEGGIEKLREDMMESMQSELNIALRNKFRDEIFNLILEKNPLELPEALVQEEQKHLQQQAEAEYKRRTQMTNAPQFPLEKYKKLAQKRVKLSLIGKELIEKYDLKPDEQQVDRLVDEYLQHMGSSTELKNYIVSNQHLMERFNNEALEIQLIEKLAANLNVMEKEKPYFHVMRGEFADSGME